MKKKCFASDDCPLSRGYEAIGDWWSLLIINRIMFAGTRRFNEIQEALGMAKNILTDRLSKLVSQGLLEKVPAADGSAFREYALTPKGKDLYIVLIALRQWGEAHFFDDQKLATALVDRKKGKLIPPITVRSKDGRVVTPEDLMVVRASRLTK